MSEMTDKPRMAQIVGGPRDGEWTQVIGPDLYEQGSGEPGITWHYRLVDDFVGGPQYRLIEKEIRA